MRKKPIRLYILIGTFLAAMIFFSLISGTNGGTDETESMADATYPVLYFYEGSTRINETHGYAQEMNSQAVRNTLTPLEENLDLQIELDTYGNDIEGLSYQVRSLDGEDLLEDTEVTDYSESGDAIEATLELQNLLDTQTEYLLMVDVDLGSQDVYYYTRIMRRDDIDVEEALDFCMDFHDVSFSESDGSDIATYMEPDTSLDTSTDLSTVTINSTLDQVMWAGLDPEIVSDVNVNIAELNTGYEAITIDYMVSAEDSDGSTRYYDVEEYYRLRVGEERVYLLDYSRTMSQYFDAAGATYDGSSLQLGIRDQDVNYVSNENGTIVGFVQNGQLWQVNQETSQVTEVYSFMDTGDTDERDTFGNHDIYICSMDESGSMEFIVYGYMNRGDHEGQVGVGVYRYDSSSGQIEEEVFIPSDKSYEILKEEIGDLFYVNSDNQFFMLVGDTLYQVDLDGQTATAVETGLEDGNYVVSDNDRYIAWIAEEDTDSASTLYIRDLNAGTTDTIEAASGTYIAPLGYLDTDLVYGLANQSDLTTDLDGNVTFPMSSVVIVDDQLSQIKEYASSGYYVLSAYMEDDALQLERVTESGDAYVAAAEDTIIDYEEATSTAATLGTTYTEDCEETQVQIVFSDEFSDTSPRVITADQRVNENVDDLTILKGDMPTGIYYVYKAGKILDSYTVLSDAITEASQDGGVVIDSENNYIWSRNKSTSTSLASEISVPESASDSDDIAQALDAIIQMEDISNNAEEYLDSMTVYETMESIFPDYMNLDLTGCSLEDVLYYVSEGSPVVALTSADTAVLIVGYDEYNTTIFDPSTGETSKMGLEDSESYFSGFGSVYYSYLK